MGHRIWFPIFHMKVRTQKSWGTCRVPQPGEPGAGIQMSVLKPLCLPSPQLHLYHPTPRTLSVGKNSSPSHCGRAGSVCVGF